MEATVRGQWLHRLAAFHRRRGFLGVGLTLFLVVALNTWPGAIAAPQAQVSPTVPPTAAPARPKPVLYTLDLRETYTRFDNGVHPFNVGEPGKSKTYEELLRDYDLLLFVSTLQGIVNRGQPRLYVYHATGIDDYWLQMFRTPGEWLFDYDVVPLADLDALLATFGGEVTGTVVWDDRVPATLNVATTIAGVENTPVVRRGSALYDQITKVMPVRTDLSGRFASKAEAYRWAVQQYVQTGLTNPRLLAYIEDGWPAVLFQRQTQPGGALSTVARDYIVQNRGFAFDLSVWADEAPVDEPNQPLGQDRAVFEEILLAARARAGQQMIAMWGIIPWWQKYSNSPGGGGSHAPTDGEWEVVWLASSYGVYSTGTLGDVYGLDMANASVHRFAPFPSHVPRLPSPNPDELRSQGYLQGGVVAPKTYVMYYMGDFDYAQPLYALMPDLWQDEHRGDLPLAWGINPEIVDIFPDILSYVARTRTSADYFVAADSGAGYINPEAIPAALRSSWQMHATTYYHRLGLSITGFLLNGKGGETPEDVISLYEAFSGDGIVFNNRQLVGNWPRLDENVPLTAFPHYGLSNAEPLTTWTEEIDKAYTDYQSSHGADRPVFMTLRCVYTTPTFLVQLTEELRRQHPERDYQVVDPYTFFYLMRTELGGTNERRGTFLQPMLPEEMTAGVAQAVQVPVRNDGWETWPSSTVGLGFDIAETATAGDAPGATGEALFLPLDKPVAPGEVYTFTFLLGAPVRAGDYVVQYDMLEQPWAWFHADGNSWVVETVSVKEPAAGMQMEPPILPPWPTPDMVGPNAPPPFPTPQQMTRMTPTATVTATVPVTPAPTTATAPPAVPAGWDEPPAIERALSGRAIWAIARDTAGRTWFGGEQGVIAFDAHDDLTPDDDEWTIYTEDDGLPNQWVTAIAADPRGGVWFGTQGGGAAYFDKDGWFTYSEDDGLASNWIRAIAVDAQGLVWFATSKGISVFSGTTWQTFTHNDSPLPRDVVTAIALDKDGNRWFGTEGGGVTRVSANGRDWHTYTTADGLGDDFVLSLAADANGYIWAGTWRGGLSVFDGTKWLTYKTENSGLNANWVQAVAVDAQGHIWCGTYGLPGAGISVLTPGTGQWSTYGPADGLPSDNVTVLAATRPGEVWVGTEMGAVRYLEPLLLFAPAEAPTPTPAPDATPWPGPTRPGGEQPGFSSQGGGELNPALAGFSSWPLQVTPTATRLPSPTQGTPVPTVTRLPSPTPPITSLPTVPPTAPTSTSPPTNTPSPSPSPTVSPTSSPTATPSATPTASPTSATLTPSPTGTRTATPTPTGTAFTATPTASPTWTPYVTSTPYATPSPTPTGGCPVCPPRPPAPPPPLPTKEEDLDLVHTFTASSGTVKRVNERPGGNALRVPETQGIGGRAIRVYVNADTLVWVAGIQLELTYDTSILTAAGVNLTPRSEAMTRPEPVLNPSSGKVNLLLFSPEGQAIPPGRGPILSLLFEVRSGSIDGQKAQVHIAKAILTDVDGNKINVPASFIYDGYLVICTTCFLHNGDIDKDGSVTVIDVQRGINIVLGRHIADDEEVVALDINGDGTADVLDVIKLANLALGRVTPTPWVPTPTPGMTPTPGPTYTPMPTWTPSPTGGTPVPTAAGTPGTPTPTASPTASTPAPTAIPTAGTPGPTASPTRLPPASTPSPSATRLPTPIPTPYPLLIPAP
jgi:hypothetical protein